MNYIKIMTTALTMLLCYNSVTRANEPQHGDPDWQFIGYIELGTKWEMEVKSNIFADKKSFNVTQWLEGTEEINGQKYMKLWSQVEDETPQITTYLRIDMKTMCIYAISSENINMQECLIYDFYNRNKPDIPIVPIRWDGKLSDKSYLYTSTNDGELDFSHLVGYKYSITKVSLYEIDDTETNNCVGEVKWYRGIGNPAGLTNQCYCLDTEYTTTLRKVYHCGVDLVYDMPVAGIGNITDTTSVDGIKYRPDGTRFNDGDKGIYIMNGKKYVRY